MPSFWCAVCEKEVAQVLPGPCGCELVVCHGTSDPVTSESAPDGVVFKNEAREAYVEHGETIKGSTSYARAIWSWKGRRR